jgi:hypothetical protein
MNVPVETCSFWSSGSLCTETEGGLVYGYEYETEPVPLSLPEE